MQKFPSSSTTNPRFKNVVRKSRKKTFCFPISSNEMFCFSANHGSFMSDSWLCSLTTPRTKKSVPVAPALPGRTSPRRKATLTALSRQSSLGSVSLIVTHCWPSKRRVKRQCLVALTIALWTVTIASCQSISLSRGSPGITRLTL